MNKKEVRKRILCKGKRISLDDFSWDKKTRTFSSLLDYLVLDFGDISNCTFKTYSNCTFNTGFNCTFNTGFNCTFDTGYNCTFNTGFNCTFNTSYNCIFDTGYICTFNTGSSCTFNTGAYCTFSTSHNCTFKTGSSCTFNTGIECVVFRREIFEVIKLKENKPIKLNTYMTPGYIYLNNHVIKIDNKEISISEDSYNKLKKSLTIENK